jgi:hypothetical protein
MFSVGRDDKNARHFMQLLNHSQELKAVSRRPDTTLSLSKYWTCRSALARDYGGSVGGNDRLN